MLGQSLRIHLFFTVFSVNVVTQEYYYARRGPYFDIVYGERPLDSDFKKVKSPKLLNYNYLHSEEGMTECSEEKFTCLGGPYSRSQTAAFECSLDRQCPKNFRCCENACFEHKICQPAKPIRSVGGKDILRTPIPEPQNSKSSSSKTTIPRSSVTPGMTTSVDIEANTSGEKDSTENSSMLPKLETGNADIETPTDEYIENSMMNTSPEPLNRTTFQMRTSDSTSSDDEESMTVRSENNSSVSTFGIFPTISEDDTTMMKETDTTVRREMTSELTPSITGIPGISRTPIPNIIEVNTTETSATIKKGTGSTIPNNRTTRTEMTSSTIISGTQITGTEVLSTNASTSENSDNIEIHTDMSMSTVTTSFLVEKELSSTHETNMPHYEGTKNAEIKDIPLTETTNEPLNTESIRIEPENFTSSSENEQKSNITDFISDDRETNNSGNEMSVTTIRISPTIAEEQTTMTKKETSTTIHNDHTTQSEMAPSIVPISDIIELNITRTLETMTMKSDITIPDNYTTKTGIITQIPGITRVDTSDMMTQETHTRIYTGDVIQTEAVSSVSPISEIIEVNTTGTSATIKIETGSTIPNDRTTRTSTTISGNQMIESEMRSTQASTLENFDNIEIQTDISMSTSTLTTPSLVEEELSSMYETNIPHYDATKDAEITDAPSTEISNEPPNTESIRIEPESFTSSSENEQESNITNLTSDNDDLMTPISKNIISVITISIPPTIAEEQTTMMEKETNTTMSNDHTTGIEMATTIVTIPEIIESNITGTSETMTMKTDSTISDDHTTTETEMNSEMTSSITQIPGIIKVDITETSELMTQETDTKIYTGHTNQTDGASSITPISEITEVDTTGTLATIWIETSDTISNNFTRRREMASSTTISKNDDDKQTLENTVVDHITTSTPEDLILERIETTVTPYMFSAMTSTAEDNTNSLNIILKTSEAYIDRTITTNSIGELETKTESPNSHFHTQTKSTPPEFEDKQETNTMPNEDISDVTSEDTKESATTENIDRITIDMSDERPIVQSKFAEESNKNPEINISSSATASSHDNLHSIRVSVVGHASTTIETSASVPSKSTDIDENEILSEITTISSFSTSKSIYSQENKIEMSTGGVEEGYTPSENQQQTTNATDSSPVDGKAGQTEISDDSTSTWSSTGHEMKISSTSSGSSPNQDTPKPIGAAQGSVPSIIKFVSKYMSNEDSDKSYTQHSRINEESKNQTIDGGFIFGRNQTENVTGWNSDTDKYSKPVFTATTTVDEEHGGSWSIEGSGSMEGSESIEESGSVEGSGGIEGSGSIEGSGISEGRRSMMNNDDDDDDDDDAYDDDDYDHDDAEGEVGSG